MNIIKPIGVFIQDRSYLITRDHDENFFKNVGGRMQEDETEFDCLKRTLKTDLDYVLDTTPELIFDFPPTPAQGDPGDTVTLLGYLISKDTDVQMTASGNVDGLVWVNTQNAHEFTLTPQITELILPKLKELGLIN